MLLRNILLFVGVALAAKKTTVTVTTTAVAKATETNYDTVVIVDNNSNKKVEVLTADVDLSPVIKKKEKPEIPENKKPDVSTSVCSKDLLLMGNKIEKHSVCNGIYKACTTKELLSIMLGYYTKTEPVSIEYIINDGVNKGSVSEKCGAVLVNSKVFFENTTVIKAVEDVPPVEKITVDIPIEAPLSAQDQSAVKEIDRNAEFGEDPIEQ